MNRSMGGVSGPEKLLWDACVLHSGYIIYSRRLYLSAWQRYFSIAVVHPAKNWLNYLSHGSLSVLMSQNHQSAWSKRTVGIMCGVLLLYGDWTATNSGIWLLGVALSQQTDDTGSGSDCCVWWLLQLHAASWTQGKMAHHHLWLKPFHHQLKPLRWKN